MREGVKQHATRDPRSGLNPCGWAGSGCGFEHLLFEPDGAAVAEWSAAACCCRPRRCSAAMTPPCLCRSRAPSAASGKLRDQTGWGRLQIFLQTRCSGSTDPSPIRALSLTHPAGQACRGLLELRQVPVETEPKKPSPPSPNAVPGARPTLALSTISNAALRASLTPSTEKKR